MPKLYNVLRNHCFMPFACITMVVNNTNLVAEIEWGEQVYAPIFRQDVK